MKTIKMIMDVPIDVYTRFVALNLGTPLNEVLDKIRDEMQKEKENIHFDLNEQKAKWVNSGIYDGLTWAQEIIDKYTKGEGE